MGAVVKKSIKHLKKEGKKIGLHVHISLKCKCLPKIKSLHHKRHFKKHHLKFKRHHYKFHHLKFKHHHFKGHHLKFKRHHFKFHHLKHHYKRHHFKFHRLKPHFKRHHHFRHHHRRHHRRASGILAPLQKMLALE